MNESERYKLHKQLEELGFTVAFDGIRPVSTLNSFRPRAYWSAKAVYNRMEVMPIGLSKIKEIRASPIGVQVHRIDYGKYFVGLPDELATKLKEYKELHPC